MPLGLSERQAAGCAWRSLVLLIIVLILVTIGFVLGYRVADAVQAHFHIL